MGGERRNRRKIYEKGKVEEEEGREGRRNSMRGERILSVRERHGRNDARNGKEKEKNRRGRYRQTDRQTGRLRIWLARHEIMTVHLSHVHINQLIAYES